MFTARPKIADRDRRPCLARDPPHLRIGLPIGALRGLEIGLFVTTGILMGVLGADALGAHQLVFNVLGVCFMIPLGLGQAATVRVAFQLGAGAPGAELAMPVCRAGARRRRSDVSSRPS